MYLYFWFHLLESFWFLSETHHSCLSPLQLVGEAYCDNLGFGGRSCKLNNKTHIFFDKFWYSKDIVFNFKCQWGWSRKWNIVFYLFMRAWFMVSVFHSHLMYHLATADDFQICSVKSKDRVFDVLITEDKRRRQHFCLRLKDWIMICWLTDLWSSISLISDTGSLKYTVSGCPSAEEEGSKIITWQNN